MEMFTVGLIFGFVVGVILFLCLMALINND